MSERGSFVTEYCYCNKCFEVLKKHLLDTRKHLCSVEIPFPSDCHKDYPEQKLQIIAGKIGGMCPGEETVMFMDNYGEAIEKEICHPVRIAVLTESENHNKIFRLKPRAGKVKDV